MELDVLEKDKSLWKMPNQITPLTHFWLKFVRIVLVRVVNYIDLILGTFLFLSFKC